MEWKEIHTLLSKTVSAISGHQALRRRVATAVCDLIGSPLVSENDVSIKGFVVYIKAHSALKNELLIRKRELLDKLNSNNTGGWLKDVR